MASGTFASAADRATCQRNPLHVKPNQQTKQSSWRTRKCIDLSSACISSSQRTTQPLEHAHTAREEQLRGRTCAAWMASSCVTRQPRKDTRYEGHGRAVFVVSAKSHFTKLRRFLERLIRLPATSSLNRAEQTHKAPTYSPPQRVPESGTLPTGSGARTCARSEGRRRPHVAPPHHSAPFPC